MTPAQSSHDENESRADAGPSRRESNTTRTPLISVLPVTTTQASKQTATGLLETFLIQKPPAVVRVNSVLLRDLPLLISE